MLRLCVHCGFVSLLVLTMSTTASYAAADDKPAAAVGVQVPEIADEPRLIDPATVMPAPLAATATVELSDSSLREVIQWLQVEQKLVVLTESSKLAEVGVQPGEPVSDRLDDAPIYLLLNRLRGSGLAWYYEDEILHITSRESAAEHLTTIPYNLGDLLDAGYDTDDLRMVIENAIAPDSWQDVGGLGVLNFLGDVMFLRHSADVHRQVTGLLAALRKHGRQTFVLDPPQHLVLRQKLNDNVSVDFHDTPLDTAIARLSEDLKIDIRLDLPALREIRVRERQPVSLVLTDRTLKTVLQAMVIDFDLTWILRDGVLWLTSSETAESYLRTVVYDVRDLCRDQAESQALREAVASQTNADSWDDVGGPGSIQFAKPGTLVIRNQETVQMEVLDLLDTYRAALRISKPRNRQAVDPNEVITVYYRLHANVAQSLAMHLPVLVQPDTWINSGTPGATGTIVLVESKADLMGPDGQLAQLTAKTSNPLPAHMVARSVLIINQKRAIHDQIAEVMRRVDTGDGTVFETFGGGQGLGGGGGGFGGGYFSLPIRHTK